MAKKKESVEPRNLWRTRLSYLDKNIREKWGGERDRNIITSIKLIEVINTKKRKTRNKKKTMKINCIVVKLLKRANEHAHITAD